MSSANPHVYAQQVIKRSGQRENFNPDKIQKALRKCLDPSKVNTVLNSILLTLPSRMAIPIEDIQDTVVKVLNSEGFENEADQYQHYRDLKTKQRQIVPIDAETQKLFDSNAAYFKTPLQLFQFFDKYSKWIPELNRRETWPETTKRVIEFLKKNCEISFEDTEWAELQAAMLTMQVMPSMRVVQMAGPALERDNTGAYNCAYLAVDSLDAFAELLYILMQGTGCGYSVEDRYISKLPKIKKQGKTKATSYVIVDSTDGWCDAVKAGLAAWFSGKDIKFDYSQVRPAGSILKTKGGRSAGPEPLRELLAFIRTTVLGQQGKRLSALNCHDICCYCGFIVQVGGVRRAALISLSDLDDSEITGCKNGEFWNAYPQRAMANNSAVFEDKPSATEFMEEWLNLAKSGTGERGIFNRKGAIPGRRKFSEFGLNPCLYGGTLIHTANGHYPIESLVGKTADIWDGSSWQAIDNFRVTAENQPMLKITMQDGSFERVTPYHSMLLADGSRCLASELSSGMALQISAAPIAHGIHHEPGAYLKGFLVADGTHIDDRPLLYLYAPKYSCMGRLIESALEIPVGSIRTNSIESPDFNIEIADSGRRIMTGLGVRKTELIKWTTDYKTGLPASIFAWDMRSKMEFIAGLMDGYGGASDTSNGFMYQLTSSNMQLLLDVQMLLKTCGVWSRISEGSPGGLKDFNDGYGSYNCSPTWRITVSQASAIVLAKNTILSRLVSFKDKKTSYIVKPKRNTVVSVEEDGIDSKVYCCTVPSSHSLALSGGIQIGQCGEILLRSNQFCNLSIVVARENDDLNTLQQKIRLATMFGTAQATLTYFPYLNSNWVVNCKEERLLGVDITGQRDCRLLQDTTIHGSVFNILKNTAVETNRALAERFNINQSTAVTCVKPSGNSSQLLGCSSGLHIRYAPYYIRRVRTGSHTPVTRLLKEAGVPWHPETGQSEEDATVIVFEFPVKSPDSAICRSDISAKEQFEYWLVNKEYYTEHSASCTIYVEDTEWLELGALVYKNWNKISGLSFLPKSDHIYLLAPYEEITKEQYEQRVKDFPDINYAKLCRFEIADSTNNNLDYACTSGSCEL